MYLCSESFFGNKLVCYHPAGVITVIICIPPLFPSSQPRIVEELKNKILKTFSRVGAVGSGLLLGRLHSFAFQKVLTDTNKSCKPAGRVFDLFHMNLSQNPTDVIGEV